MKNKVLSKLVSFVLSASTLVSCFSVAPSYAKSKLTLSKEAKIGVGVGAGILGAGLLAGTLLILKYGSIDSDKDTGENKNESKSSDVSGERKQTNTSQSDVPIAQKPNVNAKERNMWKILENNLEENAEWVGNTYPALKENFSKIVLGSDVPNIKITFIFNDGTCHPTEFEFCVKNVEETTKKLGVVAKQLLVYKRRSVDKLPKIQIQVGERSFCSAAVPSPTPIKADDYSTPEGIQESLARRAEDFKKLDESEKKSRFENNWGQLCYFLGSQENIDWVEENYPEWKERMSKGDFLSPDYPTICGTNLESFSLISIAYSLLSAKAEGYNPADKRNNELIVGMPDISGAEAEVERPSGTSEEVNATRCKKVEVLPEDILCCAHEHFYEWSLKDKKIGFLNAGDPYDPNGFLPNNGSVLEEYLSNMTTLIRDLSYKAFRRGSEGCVNGGFYDTRENFPPVVCFGRNRSDPWKRLTGEGRDFYHERGIMSKKVRLMRPIDKDVWRNYGPNLYNFSVDSGGLYDKEFCVLSIAGLEDRSKLLLCDGYGEHSAVDYRTEWKKITKKQCEFVLKSFIKEGVRVPFLCPFGAGAFGGSSLLVVQCFYELLIEEGYADYFDKVVFPVLYGADSITGKPTLELFKIFFDKK